MSCHEPDTQTFPKISMEDILDDLPAHIRDLGTEKRYLLIHNESSERIYPGLYVKKHGSDELLMDPDPPPDKTKDIPSGFKLEPNEFRFIVFPRYTESGRVWARTGCTYHKRDDYKFGGTTPQCGLLCNTGDCPMDAENYPKSDKGLRCGVKGGIAPVTAIEFSLVENVDFYDISQVDGNNIGASMKPIGVTGTDFAETPPQEDVVDKTNLSGSQHPVHMKDALWCTESRCNPVKDETGCPKELRVYSRDENDKGKFVTCQSICHAVTQVPQEQVSEGKFKNLPLDEPPGYTITGSQPIYNDKRSSFQANDKDLYQNLWNVSASYMRWDASDTTPLDDVAFPCAKDDPETKTCTSKMNALGKRRDYVNTSGRWVNDTTQQCTEESEDCVLTRKVVCCESGKGNLCGDVDANTPEKPKLPQPGQGCSPYVVSARKNAHRKHLCWSETWPDIPGGELREWCKGKIDEAECSYSNVYKKQCSKAYSWQFDDLNSTYTCSAPGPLRNQKGTHKLPNYYITFFDKSNTWDKIQQEEKIQREEQIQREKNLPPESKPETEEPKEPEAPETKEPEAPETKEDPKTKEPETEEPEAPEAPAYSTTKILIALGFLGVLFALFYSIW